MDLGAPLHNCSSYGKWEFSADWYWKLTVVD